MSPTQFAVNDAAIRQQGVHALFGVAHNLPPLLTDRG